MLFSFVPPGNLCPLKGSLNWYGAAPFMGTQPCLFRYFWKFREMRTLLDVLPLGHFSVMRKSPFEND